MNNQQPGISFSPGASATPAPIHDIVGPLPFFTGPIWVILLSFLLVALLGGGVWWFFLRRKIKLLTPRQAALASLSKLREKVSEGDDKDFGAGVSDVLRRFLGEAFGLAAPRQTTEEFLLSLQGSLVFIQGEQESLAGFLRQADYLKYAQGAATREERLALIEAAESFVRSGDKDLGDSGESGETSKTKHQPKEGA